MYLTPNLLKLVLPAMVWLGASGNSYIHYIYTYIYIYIYITNSVQARICLKPVRFSTGRDGIAENIAVGQKNILNIEINVPVVKAKDNSSIACHTKPEFD